MRAKTVNENYPLGAENDPMAPWNEKEDDSNFELEAENNDLNNLYITRRYNQTAEDEWDEDRGDIDPERLEEFAAEKLDIDYGQKLEDDAYLEVTGIADAQGGFEFTTSWGKFEATMDELIGLTNIF